MADSKFKVWSARVLLGLRLGIAGMIFLVGAYPLALVGWDWVTDAEPPTLEEMRESCREDAALNGTTPDDQEYMSRCVDAWVISTSDELSIVFLIPLLVISGVLLLIGGFWLRSILREPLATRRNRRVR